MNLVRFGLAKLQVTAWSWITGYTQNLERCCLSCKGWLCTLWAKVYYIALSKQWHQALTNTKVFLSPIGWESCQSGSASVLSRTWHFCNNSSRVFSSVWNSRRIISGSAVSKLLTDYKQGIMHQDSLATSSLLPACGFIIPNLYHTYIYTVFPLLYLARKALLLLFSLELKCEPLSPQNWRLVSVFFITVSFTLQRSLLLHWSQFSGKHSHGPGARHSNCSAGTADVQLSWRNGAARGIKGNQHHQNKTNSASL